MTNYNYYEAIKNDILDYINENIDFSEYEDLEELEQYLNDELFTEDSVTGNASGSYTFNSYVAQEYVCDNMDLLQQACEEFGTSAETIGNDLLNEEWEKMDIYIRCYLLGECISEVIEEIQDDFEQSKETA